MSVVKFIEKPTNQKANLIYNKNNYFWNSGIFFGKSGMIQTSIMTHAKEVAKKCEVAFNTIWTNPEETEYFFSKNNIGYVLSLGPSAPNARIRLIHGRANKKRCCS